MLRIVFCLGFSLFTATTCIAQSPPFFDEIKAFKLADQQKMPAESATLFVGSSSIRLWVNLEKDFPELSVINRGFGGSTLEHLIWYLEDIVLPYKARQIVIYCGENDIASGTTTPEEVLHRLQIVIMKIRRAYPQVPIFFISLKPSISRMQYLEDLKRANSLISNYLETVENATFVDVFQPMLTALGKPRPEIFVEDNLHLNDQGYDIWKKILHPYLVP